MVNGFLPGMISGSMGVFQSESRDPPDVRKFGVPKSLVVFPGARRRWSSMIADGLDLDR